MVSFPEDGYLILRLGFLKPSIWGGGARETVMDVTSRQAPPPRRLVERVGADSTSSITATPRLFHLPAYPLTRFCYKPFGMYILRPAPSRLVDRPDAESLHPDWYGALGAMVKNPAKRRVRQPDVTRDKLLQAAFEEIYRRGFQAASLDTILAKAGVTKGALYHHFPDKASLGYAVVDEVVRGLLLERWGVLEPPTGDPVTSLQRVLRRRAAGLSAREVELGCPLNNLAQEMSPLDQRFRQKVAATFDIWTDGFAKTLERGQAEGKVRRDVDARQVAGFVVAAIEGSFGLAKSAQSPAMLRSNLEILAAFLDTLRPALRNGRRGRPRTAGA